jgi:hypothetical protein
MAGTDAGAGSLLLYKGMHGALPTTATGGLGAEQDAGGSGPFGPPPPPTCGVP